MAIGKLALCCLFVMGCVDDDVPDPADPTITRDQGDDEGGIEPDTPQPDEDTCSDPNARRRADGDCVPIP